jgi:hypothetical protein
MKIILGKSDKQDEGSFAFKSQASKQQQQQQQYWQPQ